MKLALRFVYSSNAHGILTFVRGFMGIRVRVLLAAIAGALLATLGVGAALAVTPNDVQYNETTTTATTATTTTAGANTTTAATTAAATTTEAQGAAKGKFKPPAAKASGGLTPAKTTGTLPFTGLDLGLALLAAGLLLAGGFALRKFGRKSDGSTL